MAAITELDDGDCASATRAEVVDPHELRAAELRSSTGRHVDWYEAWAELNGEPVLLQVFSMRSMSSGAAFHRCGMYRRFRATVRHPRAHSRRVVQGSVDKRLCRSLQLFELNNPGR
jgi:hypothetical protein